MKVIDLAKVRRESVEREAKMLEKLQHPCVTVFHSVSHTDSCAALVMDLCQGGTLHVAMEAYWLKYSALPPLALGNIAKTMVQAVEWLHQNCICHRDIKVDNFLLDREDVSSLECRVFLSDFGCACFLTPGEDLNEAVGTQMYWAPEVYRRSYGFPVDAWALGMIIFWLFYKAPPVETHVELDLMRRRRPPGLTQEAEDLLRSLLAKDPALRITPTEALQHDFLSHTRSAAEIAEVLPLLPCIPNDTCEGCVAAGCAIDCMGRETCDSVVGFQSSDAEMFGLGSRSSGSGGDPRELHRGFWAPLEYS